MRNQQLLLPVAVVGIAIAVLYPLGLFYSLFWHLWWYDIILHFLGGAWIAFLAYFVFSHSQRMMLRATALLVFLALISLVVGIGWEVFEYVTKMTWSVEGYWQDTSLDIVMDMLGGFCAFLYLLALTGVRTETASGFLTPRSQ